MNLDSISAFYQSIPTDWIIIGAFAIFAAYDALRHGARRICALALAMPIATLIMAGIPKTVVLGTLAKQFATPLLQAILFFIVLAVIFAIIHRIGLSGGTESGQTLQAALCGVAATAIVLTLWIGTPALEGIWHFSPQIQMIFGESYRVWWLIGSYTVLAFVRSS